MTLLTELILACSKNFDDGTYPPEVYFYLLDRVREAKSPDALGSALMHLLAWKDGKVRKDAKGPYKTLRPKDSYRVGNTKPNTLSDRHEKILKSEEFFAWASEVRKTRTFDADLISDLQQTFGLWKEMAIVMPAFLIHCLRPPIYPIVDRYVIVVYNIFQSNSPSLRANPTRITAKAYSDYHSWWLRLVQEVGVRPLSAEINQLKDIDSGIWSLGKSISSRAKEMLKSEEENESSSIDQIDDRSAGKKGGSPPRGTKSPEFRTRAIELWRKGDTQAKAIQKAAMEMRIDLKDSYQRYPGSHFDRWRKQGHWNRQD
jgi:hypothetical protein